jgi:hypothetical protein
MFAFDQMSTFAVHWQLDVTRWQSPFYTHTVAIINATFMSLALWIFLFLSPN